MKINKNSILCFFIMFTSVFFRYLAIWDLISTEKRYMLLPIVIILFIIYLCNKKISKNRITFIIFILIMGLLDFLITNEIDIFIPLLFAIIYMRKNGDRDFLKHFVICSSLFYLATIILCKVGIIENTEFIRVVDNKTIIRNTLGFTNPNHALTLLTPIIISLSLILNLNSKKKKIIFSIFALLISYLIYYYTNSRTGFYCIILFIILLLIIKNNNIIIVTKAKYLFFLFTIITFIIAFVFGNTSSAINNILTNRPVMWKETINRVVISLFGNSTIKVDNNYLWLLYRHGLIIYIFYMYIYGKATNYFVKNNRLFISMFLVLIYSLFENTLNYVFNPIFTLSIMYLLNFGKHDMYLYNNDEGEKYE